MTDTAQQLARVLENVQDAGRPSAWVKARAHLGRLVITILRTLVAFGRYVLTVWAAARCGLRWRTFCGNTGLAKQRQTVHGDDFTSHVSTKTYAVPKLRKVRIGQHGWTVCVQLRPGQDLADYAAAAAPLRHLARAQSVRPRELWDRPGFVELAILRRDPLRGVLERPRELERGVIVAGTTETGEPLIVDFNAEPHWLVSGATDSGKSSLIATCLAALAPTRDVLISWDLKFGIEGEAFRRRFTDVATAGAEVQDWCGRLLALAGERAELFKTLRVANVREAEQLRGVVLRRVYVWCDEVAELATARNGEVKPEELLSDVLRVVQLCRAMGIHVVIAGQRFGSDLGKLVTAVRAQLGGRICLRVNDEETAKMVLAGLDPDVHHRAMGLPHKGMAIVKRRAEWEYARATYQTSAERYAIGDQYARNRITWNDLLTEDRAIAAAATTHGY
jgi:S-DNA-T family DNA segregation ATPase FtsK/SpoIIIE